MAKRKYLKIVDESPGFFLAELGSSWLRVDSDHGRLEFDSCNMNGTPRLALWIAEVTKG